MVQRSQTVSWLLVLGLAAFVVLFVMSDARELWRALSRVDPWLATLPFLFTLLTYVTMALSYHGIARAAGHEVPFPAMLRITYVANAVNYLVTTGGLSGFAVRMYFFVRQGIPAPQAVTISLVQTLLTNGVLLLFVLVGFRYLIESGSLEGTPLVAAMALVGIFGLVLLAMLTLLVHRRLRRRVLFLLAEAAHHVLRRFAPGKKPRRVHLWRLQRSLHHGLDFLLERKRHMIAPTLWIFLDWALTILVLHSAFLAVRHPIPLSFVIIGFAIGMVLSLVSLIPGGLGVMEGSMAAIFAGLGVPFETAVVAVLLFRIAYYFLPLFLSVFLFGGMLRQGQNLTAASLEASGVDTGGLPVTTIREPEDAARIQD